MQTYKRLVRRYVKTFIEKTIKMMSQHKRYCENIKDKVHFKMADDDEFVIKYLEGLKERINRGESISLMDEIILCGIGIPKKSLEKMR